MKLQLKCQVGSGGAIGSLTVVNGETVILEKEPTDKLSAASNGSSVKVAKVAYNIS